MGFVHLKERSIDVSQEYLNFSEISRQIPFEKLLNWLNIPFTRTAKELKGENFIVTIEKNLYINTKNKDEKGSVINFLSHLNQIDLRAAAHELKNQFLKNGSHKKDESKKLPQLELLYTDQLMTYGITEEIASEYEIGLVKQRSIMSGKIALKVYSQDQTVAGYIGYNSKDGSWYFPKDFKRPVWNLHRLTDNEFIFLVANPFDALKIISFGYPHTACLLGNSMTDSQLEQLRKMEFLQSIILIHEDPMNIVGRLAKYVYVRYEIPPKPIRQIDHAEFLQFFSFSPQS